MKDGSLLLLGVAGPQLTPAESALFRALQPAGFILFTRNIVTPEQTRKLTDDLRELCRDEPILAIDQEGGRVSRTSALAPKLPSAPQLAAKADYDLIYQSATLTADLLRLLGLNMNFAPVLDLDHFPATSNALNGRSWGRDPQRVIDFAGHWNRWMRKRRVATCAKHFPAGGRAISDPHHDLPSSQVSIPELLCEDVIPYTALMPELDAIMLAHINFPEIDADFPASLSTRMIRQFLRGQLGFDHHLVLTDDLDMTAITKRHPRGDDARLAIQAGNDLAMICHHTQTAEVAAHAIGTLPTALRDEAAARIDRFRKKKLTSPLTWSRAHWETTVHNMQKLSCECAEESAGSSPVSQY